MNSEPTKFLVLYAPKREAFVREFWPGGPEQILIPLRVATTNCTKNMDTGETNWRGPGSQLVCDLADATRYPSVRDAADALYSLFGRFGRSDEGLIRVREVAEFDNGTLLLLPRKK